MKNLFVKEEVNTSRQFAFDFAKAITLYFMVTTHCFEYLYESGEGVLFYIFVVIIDVLLGASVYVGSMGLGLAYNRKKTPIDFIKRGLKIFFAGYLLNILREGIPFVLVIFGKATLDHVLIWTIATDILHFAGLSLMLFGFLKKIKCSDMAILVIALIMSIIGSAVRFIDFGNITINQIMGLFIGTYDPIIPEDTSPFPIFHWFIIVVLGYLYGKLLRHCKDLDDFYKIVLPISALVLILYAVYAIPNHYGMMSGNLIYYYNFSTPNVVVLFSGVIFETSLLHFASKLLNKKMQDAINYISSIFSPVYFIQWIIIGLIIMFIELFDIAITNEIIVLIMAIFILILSVFLASKFAKPLKKLFS